ncbi:MAG: glycosyltransferase family 1 protein [Candidatus Pacearchaeota archaeon]
MQIIYDNIIFSLQKAGGISLYWSELIKRIIHKEKNIIFYEFENTNIFRKRLNIRAVRESNLPLKIIRYLPFTKKLPPFSIFHSSYYRVSIQKDIINITTVHDFTYEYFRTGLAKYMHSWQKGFAIKKSDGIICISENTKKDLLKFYPMIDESKIKVIYHGVGEEFTKLENPQEYLKGDLEILKDKQYILYVGDRSSYKNFPICIEIIKELRDFSLVVVGGKEFSTDEIHKMKDIRDRVFYFRGVDGKKLNIIYNNAFCLIYPSSYEGFGLPILEAMKAGCPVVSVNKSSIPEVAGGVGLLVNNIDAEEFIEAIIKLKNTKFRNELIDKGLKHTKNFSWDKCFEETYSFYEETWIRKHGG